MDNRIEVMKDEMGNYVERELFYVPLSWQSAGLQQTSTGYGNKLVSPYKVMYLGKLRRVYSVCYSNCASFFVMFGKRRIFLGM